MTTCGRGVALELDFDVVGEVAHARDVGDDLVAVELGDALLQLGAVDAVGHVGDVQEVAAVLSGDGLDLAAHAHAAVAGAEVVIYTLVAEDVAAGGEVRPLDVGAQLLGGDVLVVDVGADAVDDFAEVVRGHVGGHADGDAGAAVDEQVREGAGEDDGLLEAVVVVGLKVHRLFVQIIHEGDAEGAEARFGVSHRGGWVTFGRAEVALPFDEHVAHVPGLRHGDEGAVGGLVAVRVVVTDGVTDDFTALDGGLEG